MSARRGDVVLPRWTRGRRTDGRLVHSYVGHWQWSVKRDPDSAYGWLLTRDGRPWRSARTLKAAKLEAWLSEDEYLRGLPATIANPNPGTR